MNRPLNTRLNALLSRLTDEDLLEGRGIGNEIGYYIFDYDPDQEIQVRQYIQTLLEHLPRQRPGLRVAHVNLFDLTLDYLRSRDLLKKALKIGREQGDVALYKSLAGVVAAEKILPLLIEKAQPDEHDLILLSGIGSVYPLLRAHSLLNNTQTPISNTPIVLFYPGRYDGKHFRLFGHSTLSSPYYRAFRIEP